ncbi:MAG: HPr(Ser) kinase/phosphatase [Acidobacteriota bacterium]|nr:MAG: HPr(Ser) kinase/phosphatase [Acidobacteriota bacterium]
MRVRELLDELSAPLAVCCMEPAHGLERALTSPSIQRPGLVLAGAWSELRADQLQVLGESEVRFLKGEPDAGRSIGDRLCEAGVPAIVVLGRDDPPSGLIEATVRCGVAVLRSRLSTTAGLELLRRYMTGRLAPRIRIHGVLMDLYGLGVVILGKSGVGKSESALELLSRGHRLVADDAIDVRLVAGELVGEAPPLTRHLIEARGLGIINARDVFGISSVRATKVLQLAVELKPLEHGSKWDRLGHAQESWQALGRALTKVTIPVAPGRNLGVLLEIAARQHMLKQSGRDAGQEVQDALARKLAGGDDQSESAP